MYQIGWQRSLYGIIGVDIDSVTVIVSVFMLGIGFGGILGGWIADRAPRRRIHFYAAAEILIAAYGFGSLFLLEYMGNWLIKMGGAAAWGAIASFIFLVAPTTFMGLTLPLLTMAFNDRRKNIGVSVGHLYFFNTLGAAAGAGLVPFFFMPLISLDWVIRLAALGNLAVAVIVLLAHWRQG